MTKPKAPPTAPKPKPALIRVDAIPEKATAAGKQHITADRAAQLRADPAAWYLWPTRTGIGGVKTALGPFAEGGVFEAASRPWEGQSRTFVRWVGASPNGSAPAVEPPDSKKTTAGPEPGPAATAEVDVIDTAGPACYANGDLARRIVSLLHMPTNTDVVWRVGDIATDTRIRGDRTVVRDICRELAAAGIIKAPAGATVVAPPEPKAAPSTSSTRAAMSHEDDPGWVQCPMCREWLKITSPYGDRERSKVGDQHKKDRPDCKRKLSRLGAPWPGPA